MNLTVTYPKKDDPITTSEEFYGTSSSDDNPSKGLEYMRGSDRSSVSEEEIKEVEQEYKHVNKANFDNIDSVMTAKANDEQGRILTQQVFSKTVQLQQQPTTPEDFIERVQTDVKNTELEIEEDELLVNPTWNESGRILKSFLESTRSDKSDGEFALQLGNEMFANIGGANVSGEGTRMTGGLLPLVTKAVNSGDANVINALLYTMEMYDRKPMTSRGWVDGIGYLLGDASNYIGLGFVANATRHTVGKQMGNTAVKGMLQEALAKIASSKVGQAVAKHPVATEAVKQGAFWSAVDELGKEIIKARSGVRGNNEIDLTNIAGAGVAGGIAGLALVTVPPYIWRKGSKAVREYINRGLVKESEGVKFFKRIAGEQPIIGDEAGSLPKDIKTPKTPTGSTALTGTFDDLVGTGSLKELQAYMRHATSEERPKLIEKMKSFNKKPKAVKAREQILVQEDFNGQFYSKLEQELAKLPTEKTFKTPTEAKSYLIKSGVKPKEIEASGVLEMFDNLPEQDMNVAEMTNYLESRPDRITKRIYDEDAEGKTLDFDDWDDDMVSVDHGVQSNSSESGVATVITDENTGYDIYIEEGWNDEIYVDRNSDEIGDYNDMQEHWFENEVVESDEWYVNAKERYNDENEGTATWDNDLEYDEQRDFVIAEASDESPWYEIYNNQQEYTVVTMGDSKSTFDDYDDAEKYAKEYLYEGYEQRGTEGAEIYEDYTVDGGDNYRMNVYHMEQFETRGKDVAREPHMGEFEYGDENVQMHTRLKEREDADGNTGVVIEEVQSQWEQDWRKEGGDVKPLTPEERTSIETEMKPFNVEWSKQGETIAELKRKSNDVYSKVREIRSRQKEELNDEFAPKLEVLNNKIIELQSEESRIRLANQGVIGLESQPELRKVLDDIDDLKDERVELSKQVNKIIDDTPEMSEQVNLARDLDREASTLQTAQQEYYNRNIKPLDDKLDVKEASIATPPMQERTQYERVAILDELLMASQDGQKFFGWNNSGIQNGSRVGVDDRGREGMKNAYDLEIPRIIQKATGETPYKYYHDADQNARFTSGVDELEYWDFEKAKNLEYDDTEEWYWRVDLDDKLTSKLNDSKIELYGIGGATLIGDGATQEIDEKEQ